MATPGAHRGALRAMPASLLAACALLLGACASSSYAGIPFQAGAADPELQSLAQRAQAGDKQAQLQLGERYAAGRGVTRDLRKAEALLRAAASNTGEGALRYQPSAEPGGSGIVAPVSAGKFVTGLAVARTAWVAVRAQRASEAAPAGLGLEADIAERARLYDGDRNDGDRSIEVGRPLVLKGRFRYSDDAASERVCGLIRTLLERTRDYGMQACFASTYVATAGKPRTVFLVRYEDRYPDTPEYRHIVAEVDYFYRAPFTPVAGLRGAGPLCGSYHAVVLTAGHSDSYPIIIAPAPGGVRSGALSNCTD